jgi:AraC-like DNA-binding protein
MQMSALDRLRSHQSFSARWKNGAIALGRDGGGAFEAFVDEASFGFILDDLDELVIETPSHRSERLAPRAGFGWFVPPGTRIRVAWTGVKTALSMTLGESAFAAVGGFDADGFEGAYGFRDETALTMMAGLLDVDTHDAIADRYRESMTAALAAHVVANRRRCGATEGEESMDAARRFADPRIMRAVELIERSFALPLTLDAIAREAGMSPFAFARAFKRATGEPPHRFVTSRRIEQAKTLLRASSLSVNEIGHRVGWTNPSHFTQVFRKATGLSPRAFRQPQE